MSWDETLFAVFDDLESQAAAAYAREREVDFADRSRSEYAQVTLAARLMASVGQDVAVDVVGVGPVHGRLERVANGWFLLSGQHSDWIVRLGALGSVAGASDRAVPEIAWPATTRLSLGSALRRLADAGERCVLHRLDGGTHEGVVRRVAADFAELRSGDPARLVLVSYTALAAVQSRDAR